jgi:gamma-glutamyltranspeptidase/glutathione hydrolase
LADAPAAEADGANTTHLSIVDGEGNAVAATLSINYSFGSGFVPPGTGVLLNDEMDDFATLPGEANVYGLVGGEANRIAPGKRMLSSMTPTFLDDGHRFAVLGTPGGSRIISMVLLATLEFADRHGAHWIAARRRFHHQYLPDRIELEPGALPAADEISLGGLGHTLERLDRPYGNLQIVIRERAGRLQAASDPRGEGAAQVLP